MSLQELGTDFFFFETSLSIFLHRTSFCIPMVNDLSPSLRLGSPKNKFSPGSTPRWPLFSSLLLDYSSSLGSGRSVESMNE